MSSYEALKLDVDQARIAALNAAISIEDIDKPIADKGPVEVKTSPLPGEAIKRASQSKEIDDVSEWAKHMALGLANRLAQLRSAAEDGAIKPQLPGR